MIVFNFFAAASNIPLHFADNDIAKIAQYYPQNSAYCVWLLIYSIIDNKMPIYLCVKQLFQPGIERVQACTR